ncbi:hypothetical protein [Mycobacteroides abscessus]|uniref:hypothetical protein n=1 Tax=Mycobacteroides abscessus TaxID=36809 RepID=UPI00092CC984|nr:hypothetical protein [Mycobacteroides abscessus]SHT28837.1 Uncharacterised protein [Mycobacteroides abscessus subsp. abscessus]SHX00809.1 Uncharacterised protein [Mycobacteroides abscessus subsp. abscessus]SKG95699.1 Uncharacterised protein [Mycobacteroides abscessus subsp. abscessus]SKH50484.1 Uncharacterised protein [Mycobacteroides abscessus subsp. abscessus]SKH65847.1 Uncharacterised protein [Mycobacteroides abscessus subsp. abscessus]
MSEDKPTDLGSASTHVEALGLLRRATEQRRRCTELSGGNDGKTINKACERLIAQAQANEQKADRLNLMSQALKIREEAAARWNRNAPRDSELEAAHKAIGAASEELKRAKGLAVVAAEAKMKAAIQHSADLNERRKQADKDYADAEKRAGEKLAEVKGEKGKDGENHGKRTPGPSSTPQTKPAPGLCKGASTAAEPSGAAPTPSTAVSRVPDAGASVQDKSLSDLLVRTGQLRPRQEMQSANQTRFQQQPQVAPAAASAAPATSASARPDGRKADDALKSSDFPDMPVPFMTLCSPTLSTTTVAGSAATPQSVTAGTSASDMKTESNVSGRPDGLRGAFSPSTTASGATARLTNLQGFQAAQTQAGTAQTGVGQPGMVPPIAAGGSGMGARRESPKIYATVECTYDEGVVRGGTIAQNHPDFDDK